MVKIMQLIDFLSSNFLNDLRQNMQARLLDSTELPFRNGISYAELFDIYDGVEIHIDDINIGTNGLLHYKGIPVSLNIQDVAQDYQHTLPKLHICDCKKMKEMKTSGRLQRYISSAKTHKRRNIRFVGSNRNSTRIEEHDLDICKYCLSQLKWQGYQGGLSSAEKDFRAKNMNLADFYQSYEPQFYNEMVKILHTDQDQVAINDYQPNWAYISYSFRKSKNWRCESCGIDCSENRANLHTHHINGNKYDNHRHNLSALCYDCHAKQPMHQHMLR